MLKFDRPTLVTITAPTCSGKSYLMNKLETELGFKRIVSTTTRPRRDGEVQGVDYDFISFKTSQELEANGAFAELITFRGVRYGVTKAEMTAKLAGPNPPMVILEPQGLLEYKKLCAQNGWDIFTIYVNTVEKKRIERLVDRTVSGLGAAIRKADGEYDDVIIDKTADLVEAHTDRLLSIIGEERSWMNVSSWDAIVPGDDIAKALDYIQRGVEWRNKKNRTPAPYVHAA